MLPFKNTRLCIVKLLMAALMNPANKNKRFTGADEQIVVLYCKNNLQKKKTSKSFALIFVKIQKRIIVQEPYRKKKKKKIVE